MVAPGEVLSDPSVICQVGTGFDMRALMVDHVHAIERELDIDRLGDTNTSVQASVSLRAKSHI